MGVKALLRMKDWFGGATAGAEPIKPARMLNIEISATIFLFKSNKLFRV